jgi:glycosyltransferase involved in cell wall biosynthesis
MHVHLVVPGNIHTLTGGYIYDKRMTDGLRLKGHQIQIHSLSGEDPFSSEERSGQCWERLRAVPKGETIIFDSLVFGAIPGFLKEINQNHIIIALIHLPLSYSKNYLNTRLEKLSVSEEEAFSYADRILVTSRFTMDLLVGVGIDPYKIQVVLPGVEVFTRKAGWPKLPRNFITVSNYTKNKGYALLIEAMKEIRQLDWTLDCYGDKSFDPKHVGSLSRLIEKYRLTDRIFLHGPVSGKTLAETYVNSDLLIHPSEFETYGMVLTEALAHGIPVVASKGGAITQTVPESMGVFFEVNDSKSLQQILEKLLMDTGNYQALCRETSTYYQRAQTWGKSVEEFEKAIS